MGKFQATLFRNACNTITVLQNGMSLQGFYLYLTCRPVYFFLYKQFMVNA